ncbi:sulfatase [Arthrobacter sp. MYb211]|uniref:sulfatase family protein n=1 Tax=Micrococcaceae TaxID=1268 RepID=UPI000CFC5187|nr:MULTISPECIES: sulfatase-like hydrolase/transferase [unclassified Arthrobacter]PRA10590.1 sulfatase [Arthrobacter sp. MYb221]PRC06278.1 sulfatase [Arthrobacter sp. MYb211]
MSGPEVTRPNILVFIADQLRADHLGAYGNDEVRTPNLDRLAERSTVYENAHVANPTCMPNRASLLTGRWPSAHGTQYNGIPVDPEASTFVRQLASCGYRTSAVGKLHHQNMGWDFEPEQLEQIRASAPGLMDPRLPDAFNRLREPGWDQCENRERHAASFIPMPEDYYGYQNVDLVIGHGDAPGGHWAHWAREQGIDPELLGGSKAGTNVLDSWEQVYTSSIPASAHPTRYIGVKASEQVRKAAGEDDPFFMFVSFPDPHHPFAPPREYSRRYDPDSLSLPVGFGQDHSRSPEHIRKMIAQRGQPNGDPTMTFSVTETQYRMAAAAQYGLIEFMDEQIGEVLQTLEETGQADNTIVVFTSDHGDLFGDHGLMLKHFVHYRAVTRVPLLIHMPGQKVAEHRADLISSADLAPTFMDLAQVPAFRGIQGRSLSENGELRVGDGARALLIEEDQPFSLEGLPAPVRMRSVITPEGRLTKYFGTDTYELYDHRNDYDEMENLAGLQQAQGLKHRLEMALNEELVNLSSAQVRPVASA